MSLDAAAAAAAAAFNAKYVSTNVPPGAPCFEGAHFSKLLSDLPLESSLAISVVTGVLCALKRGDLVAPLFSHLVDDAGRDPQEVFAAMRMAITTTLVFSGAPQVVPACLGLSGAMKVRGLVPAASTERGEVTSSTLELGKETHADIYKASANPEVFEMLHEYFGDVSYALIALGFGHMMGGPGLREKELVLAAAIMAMGARRQAGSHLKACFGFGWSRGVVGSVVTMVRALAEWTDVKLGEVDVDALEREAGEAMEKR